MQASPSPALIEQSRRNAKRLAKQADIPLNQAQDKIAQSHGFGNWSQFAKADGKTKPIPVAVAAPTPRGPRRYLHGDQDERNPAVYYCAECDLFGEPDHFDRPHRVPHGERALSAIERFQRSPSDYTSIGHRPENPPNILQPDIEAEKLARAAREAARSPFHRWLEQQRDRDDPVGDLAYDVMRDKSFPSEVRTLKAAKQYLGSGWGRRDAVKALSAAWQEFNALASHTAQTAVQQP